MSVDAAVKKPIILPGLANKTTRPSFSTKTADSAVATATPSPLKNSAANNLQTLKNAAVFSNGNSRSNSPYPYVGSKSSMSVNDLRMNNVHYVNSGNYTPTPRSMDRMQMRMFDQMNSAHQCNNRYGNMNTPGDGMNAMALLNQLGGTIGQIAKEVRASRPQAAPANAQERVVIDAAKTYAAPSTASAFASSDATDLLAELGSAKFSSEVKAGLTTIDAKLPAKTQMSNDLKSAIETDKTTLSSAESALTEINTNIGTKTTELRSVGSQITKLESDISGLESMISSTTLPAMKATYEAQLVSVKANLATAQAKQEQLTAQLETLKEQKGAKETEIGNLNNSIAQNTRDKVAVDTEISKLTAAKEKYTAQETKMEKSEQKDMQNLDEKIKKLAGKFASERDESKKQKIGEEYKGLAAKFNGLIDKSTAQHGFQKVSAEMTEFDGKGLLAQSGM